MSQNNLLSSHITVSSILLCPALNCVRLFTVSNTLLCPAHYCVQQNTVSTLTQRIFCSLSHFNVLQSYPAALVKHLSLNWSGGIKNDYKLSKWKSEMLAWSNVNESVLLNWQELPTFALLFFFMFVWKLRPHYKKNKRLCGLSLYLSPWTD